MQLGEELAGKSLERIRVTEETAIPVEQGFQQFINPGADRGARFHDFGVAAPFGW